MQPRSRRQDRAPRLSRGRIDIRNERGPAERQRCGSARPVVRPVGSSRRWRSARKRIGIAGRRTSLAILRVRRVPGRAAHRERLARSPHGPAVGLTGAAGPEQVVQRTSADMSRRAGQVIGDRWWVKTVRPDGLQRCLWRAGAVSLMTGAPLRASASCAAGAECGLSVVPAGFAPASAGQHRRTGCVDCSPGARDWPATRSAGLAPARIGVPLRRCRAHVNSR